MKHFNKNALGAAFFASFLLIALGFTVPVAHAASAPALGAAANYSAFGKAGVTNNSNVGTTHVWGNVGADATNVTNLSDATQVDGIIDAGAGVEAAILTAYGQLAAVPDVPVVLNLAGTNTVGPGVYNVGATTLNGVLTLSGAGVYIFRSSSSVAVTPGVGAEMKLTNGADACSVFWQIPASMTIGAGAKMIGTIIADTALISMGTNATLQGRALSRIAQVTLDSNQITEPSCTPPPANLYVIKLVVGGTAIPANFTLRVKTSTGAVIGGPAAGASAPGTAYSLSAGTYNVSEDANSSYTQSFSGACDSSGNVTLASGVDKTCTVINTNIPVAPTPSSGGGGGSVLTTRVVPLIGILKVPSPLALPTGSGSEVSYNYTVWNVGNDQSLVDITVIDDKCSHVTLISGDLNSNSKLDRGEKWLYRCATTLSTTTTNTAVATGYSDDMYHEAAIASAVATVVVGAALPAPLINVVKVPSRLTPFPVGGGRVTYTYTVTNPGVVTMHDVTVTDNKCAPLTRISGDTNNNNLLEVSETWVYTCRSMVAVSTRNVATAEGKANGFIALSYAFATVLVSTPVSTSTPTSTPTPTTPMPRLPNSGLPPEGNSTSEDIAIIFGALLFGLTAFLVLKKRTISGR